MPEISPLGVNSSASSSFSGDIDFATALSKAENSASQAAGERAAGLLSSVLVTSYFLQESLSVLNAIGTLSQIPGSESTVRDLRNYLNIITTLDDTLQTSLPIKSNSVFVDNNTGKYFYIQSGYNAIELPKATAELAASAVEAGWTIEQTGDIQGNGTQSLIWKGPNGQVASWQLDANKNFVSGAFLPTVSPGWEMKTVGDFDGSGRAELIWQNTATGEVAVWNFDGQGQFSDGRIMLNVGTITRSDGTVAPAWNIAGQSDVNNDGRPDIRWVNATTGQVAYWSISTSGAITGIT
jgi:hypothetical protein